MGKKTWALGGGLLLVLVGAVVYSVWPEGTSNGGGAGTGSSEDQAHGKSIDERLEELAREDAASDGGVTQVHGIVESDDGNPVPNADVWVTLGDETIADRLTCDVCGQALLDCSAPATGQQVIALARAGKLNRKTVATTRSGPDGRFTLEGVPALMMTIHARAGAGEGSTSLDATGLGPALPEDPDEEDVIATVTLSPSMHAQGKVVDEKNEPVAGAHVYLMDRSSGHLTELSSDSVGHFGVELPQSQLWLYVEARGFLPSVMDEMYFGSDEPAEVRLEKPRRLRVEVRMGGQPVEAAVEVTGTEHPHHLSSAGGTALFEDLGAGNVQVTASYREFVSPKTSIELENAETTMRLDLKPAARLMVEVLNEKGEPVSAHVTVEGYGESDSKDGDENGSLVVFDRLAEGPYHVQVESPGLRDAQRRIDVHAGDNKLDVVLQEATALHGHVVDAEGKPVASATVELVSQIHEAHATQTDDEGAFALVVDEPGSYEIRARSPQAGIALQHVTAPAENLTLKLDALGRLEVHVTADRAPLRGAYVTVFGSGRAAEDGTTAVTDDKGTAHVAGLHGGEYTVNVEQQGFQHLTPKTVTLTPSDKLEVTMALEKGVEIEGHVVDERGKPVANVSIRTVNDTADGGTLGMGAQAFSDEEGEFTLEGLAPGHTYSILADGEERELTAPVHAHAPMTGLTLRLDPMPSVTGRVVDESGQVLTKFRVDGRDIEATDGRFSVPRTKDADSKLVISFDADGYQVNTVERDYTNDIGDVPLKKAPTLLGTIIDAQGQGVSGVEVQCEVCNDAATTGYDGRFTLTLASTEQTELTVNASRLNQRGHAKATIGQSVTITLQEPVRVEGIVKDPQGRSLQARVTIREVNGGDEQRVDSGPDGKFAIDLPEGLWMFITRASSTGQTVKVVGPKMFVTLGAPPGTCAVTITVAESVGDAWLVPGEPNGVPLDNLDDDALYAGAVALDLPLPNRPTRAAGLQCGVYTLVTTDSSGVRRERVDVRAAESNFGLGPAPVAAPTGPGPAVLPTTTAESAADHPGEP